MPVYTVTVRKTTIEEFDVKVAASDLDEARDTAECPEAWLWSAKALGLDSEVVTEYEGLSVEEDADVASDDDTS